MVNIIGIDSAKDRVDAVALSCEFRGEEVATEILDFFSVDAPARFKKQRDESLKHMKLQLWDWIIDSPKRYGEDVVMYIEESIAIRNMRVAIQLAQTVGMLLALPYPAYLVPVDSWKKELAKAGLSKEEVVRIISGRFPASKHFGDRQDLFDATGVAVYGATDQLLRRGLGS